MKKWGSVAAEWAVLLPLWRKVLQKPWQRVLASVGTGLVWVSIIAAAAGGGGGDKNEGAVSNPDPTQTLSSASPTSDAASSATVAPTEEPTEAPTPVPTPSPTPAPQPIVLDGFGQTATDRVVPPSAISIATITHSGSSNFIVWMYQGSDKELMVNSIGSYSGSRPIFGDDEVYFDIDADGAWSLRIDPIGNAPSAEFSGTGDAVSGLIDSDESGPWEVSHDGSRNFVVWLHCADGSDLVQNEIGPVQGSTVATFGDDPCVWEVEADGNWSLAPRP